MLKTEDLEIELETLVYSKDHPSTYFGLTETAAADKLKEYGPNALTEKKSLPWYVVLLLNFTGFFNYLMWGGGILCFVSYGAQSDKTDKSNLYLGIVLICVIFITGIFTYLQTSKSAALMS